MIPLRVVWTNDALVQLAELWIEAADPVAFNSAVRSVDSALSNSPESQGLSVAEGLRRLVRAPIEVLYSVAADRAIVEIAAVKPFRRDSD